MHDIVYGTLYARLHKPYGIFLIQVSGFDAKSITASTARLSWNRPTGTAEYYVIKITNLNTSKSETCLIENSATVTTDIYSLHPYHHYKFSIAAHTVAKGPLALRTLQMPQAGMNTIMH